MKLRGICLALALAVVLCGCGAQNETPETQGWVYEEAAFRGLILTAPADVTVSLYKGVENSIPRNLVEAAGTTVNDGTVTYYFPDVQGDFHYVASGEGYYTVRKSILQKAGQTQTLNADPGKQAGTGCEPGADRPVTMYTDEFLATVLPSDPSLWPDYAEAFTTPWFTNTDRGAQQATTYDEMMEFLHGLDGADDAMYLFSAGTTEKYSLEIPLVVFTKLDLSGASTLEEVAALVRQDSKPTIFYQGMMHGREPGAGEGALAMMKLLDGAYGEALLEQVNVCAIPRLNPDGAQENFRKSLPSGIDPNRDMLRLETVESNAHHRVLQLFEPEVFIDAHELTSDAAMTEGKCHDVAMSAGFSLNNSAEFQAFSADMAGYAFDTLRQQNLRPAYYQEEINDHSAYTGRMYCGTVGMLSLLIETRGINFGTQAYARRVACQVICATEVMDYVAENAGEVLALVEGERQYIADLGATYDVEDLYVLDGTRALAGEFANEEYIYNFSDGTIKRTEQAIPYVYSVAARSRVRPTAYVIGAEEEWTQAVLELLDKHAIAYETIPAGSTVWLQTYTGTVKEAEVTEEAPVTFEKGAVVIPMNTYMGNIIACLMEPDVTDLAVCESTLAQAGMIPFENGEFPVYRYIRDLNDQGFIDYQ